MAGHDRVRFPKKRSDGSFSVEVSLRVKTNDSNDLAKRVDSWLERWTKINRYWETALFETEGGSLDFFDDFVARPSCVVIGQTSLCIRVEARPEARKSWKDWLVLRLLRDLCKEFTEIEKVEKFTSD